MRISVGKKALAIKGRLLHCFKCGWDWFTRKPKNPVHCPNCNNVNWGEPKVEKKKVV